LTEKLSWAHYVALLRVENERARQFYMDEAVKDRWSTRQLERQINTNFYERLMLSTKKDGVAAEIHKNTPAPQPRDFIRDPYVLNFLVFHILRNFMKKIWKPQK